jgi:hypothetical protein
VCRRIGQAVDVVEISAIQTRPDGDRQMILMRNASVRFGRVFSTYKHYYGLVAANEASAGADSNNVSGRTVVVWLCSCAKP